MFRCQRSRFHKREFWNSQSTVNKHKGSGGSRIFRVPTVQSGSTSAFFFFFFKDASNFGREMLNITVTSRSRIPSQSNASDRTTSAGSVKVCNKMPSYGPDGSCSCVSGCEFLFSQARVIKRKTGSWLLRKKQTYYNSNGRYFMRLVFFF